MDRLILNEKLESLRRCVQRIKDKRTQSAEALANDADRQDIITLNLTRAVQLCVDIAAHLISESRQPAPQTMADSFDHLARLGCISTDLAHRMQSAVGFRNIAIHQYQSIDWQIVHHITHERLGDFREFASTTSDWAC